MCARRRRSSIFASNIFPANPLKIGASIDLWSCDMINTMRMPNYRGAQQNYRCIANEQISSPGLMLFISLQVEPFYSFSAEVNQNMANLLIGSFVYCNIFCTNEYA